MLYTHNSPAIQTRDMFLSPLAASTEEIPIILVGPENQIEVEIFQRIAFTCSATGDPQPIYSWHKVYKPSPS